MTGSPADVLGGYAASQLALLRHVIPAVDGFRYRFAPADAYVELLRRDVSGGMQIYWTEILFRAHWSASASLIRAHSWLIGAIDAHTVDNVLIFAAACRGLLESAGDTNDALKAVPTTLAANHSMIRRAITGSLADLVKTDLENVLLEFTHARKAGWGDGPPPPLLQAKRPQQYLEGLQRAEPRIAPFYAQLCDVVHPGAMSVLAFAEPSQNNGVRLTSSGVSTLRILRNNLESLMPPVLALAVTLPMVILKTLNTFDVAPVRTPAVDTVALDGMPAWEKIRIQLREQQVPERLLRSALRPIFSWSPG